MQLTCTASSTDDTNEIRRYLAEQLAAMQPDELYGDPLDPRAPYTTELGQIRRLELHIDDIRAKFVLHLTSRDRIPVLSDRI